MKKPPPLNRDYNRDPNSQALKRRGFINHGCALGFRGGLLRDDVCFRTQGFRVSGF